MKKGDMICIKGCIGIWKATGKRKKGWAISRVVKHKSERNRMVIQEPDPKYLVKLKEFPRVRRWDIELLVV